MATSTISFIVAQQDVRSLIEFFFSFIFNGCLDLLPSGVLSPCPAGRGGSSQQVGVCHIRHARHPVHREPLLAATAAQDG